MKFIMMIDVSEEPALVADPDLQERIRDKYDYDDFHMLFDVEDEEEDFDDQEISDFLKTEFGATVGMTALFID